MTSWAKIKELPPLVDLIANYCQYKDDTEYIAGWLADNALQCGFEVQKKAKGKGKGKGKSKGRGGKQSGKSSGHESSSRKLPNPRAVRRLLRRAIDARREFNQWYKTKEPDEAESNDRHAHFADVLTAVWETLIPLTLVQVDEETGKRQAVATTVEDEDDEDSIPLANKFSELHVDQPENEEEETQAGLEDTEYTKLPKISIERPESEVEHDFFLGIYVFMNELVDVRDYLSMQWGKYRDRAADLAAISLMSNTAIMMVRREEMTLEDLERPKKYPADIYPVWTFLPMLLFRQASVLNHPTMNMERFATNQWQSLAAWSSESSDGMEESCMWTAYKVIKYAVHNSQPPPGQRGFPMGAANVDYKRSKGNPGEVSKIFKVLLQLQAVAMRSVGATVAEDEVTRGIRFAIESNTVPAWVVFGFQVILDIQKCIGADVGRPVQELQAHTGLKVDAEWEGIDRDALYPPFGPRPPHIPDLERFMEDVLQMVLNDGFGEDVRSQLGSPLAMMAPSIRCLLQRDFFLRANPIRCGLIKYNIPMQIVDKAMRIDMGLLVMTPLIHLYKACQLAYPDAPTWPDLDFLLKYQNIKHLFFGELPTTFKEAAVKFSLSMGGSPTFFAADRRKGAFRMNPYNLRLVDNPCLLSNILSAWLDGGPQAGTNIDKVTRDLFRFLDDPASLDKLASQMELSDADKKRIRELNPLPHRSIATMINSMMPYMAAESAIQDHHFDYLQLVELCNDVGRDVVRALPDYSDDKLASATIAMVLWEALEAEELAQRVSSDVSEMVRNLAGMKKANGIIQRVIRSSGDLCGSEETRKPSLHIG